MNAPIAISLHGIPPSDWLDQEIRKRAAKLDRYCRHITSCRAVVDIPHRHHSTGRQFCLRIDLSVPGETIAITRGSALDSASCDPVLVIRDVFDAARRRLQEYARRHRLEVKRHALPRGIRRRTGRPPASR